MEPFTRNEPTSLITGDQVAEILQVSRSQAYNLMRLGEIPTVQIGRLVRVRREDLQRYIQSQLRGNHLALYGNPPDIMDEEAGSASEVP